KRRGASGLRNGGALMRSLALLAVASLSVAAQPFNRARAWFPDGAGLEIHTESTGSTPINTMGSLGIRQASASPELVNRPVVDRANSLLFISNLGASKVSMPGTVLIRVEPINPMIEANILNEKRPYLRFSGAHLPTVAAVREFPAVKIGEAVTLDILHNP